MVENRACESAVPVQMVVDLNVVTESTRRRFRGRKVTHTSPPRASPRRGSTKS
uniref:Uncharacterized protein n=1 Tax=Arundo donax TaxID=35708 RepID=A0A0A9TFH0_ARUDO